MLCSIIKCLIQSRHCLESPMLYASLKKCQGWGGGKNPRQEQWITSIIIKSTGLAPSSGQCMPQHLSALIVKILVWRACCNKYFLSFSILPLTLCSLPSVDLYTSNLYWTYISIQYSTIIYCTMFTSNSPLDFVFHMCTSTHLPPPTLCILTCSLSYMYDVTFSLPIHMAMIEWCLLILFFLAFIVEIYKVVFFTLCSVC